MAKTPAMQRTDGGPDDYVCGNCENRWPFEKLEPISDYFERVSPGEEAPAGECPVCGALCHPVEGYAEQRITARIHRADDPHCTCPDCVAYHDHQLRQPAVDQALQRLGIIDGEILPNRESELRLHLADACEAVMDPTPVSDEQATANFRRITQTATELRLHLAEEGADDGPPRS